MGALSFTDQMVQWVHPGRVWGSADHRFQIVANARACGHVQVHQAVGSPWMGTWWGASWRYGSAVGEDVAPDKTLGFFRSSVFRQVDPLAWGCRHAPSISWSTSCTRMELHEDLQRPRRAGMGVVRPDECRRTGRHGVALEASEGWLMCRRRCGWRPSDERERRWERRDRGRSPCSTTFRSIRSPQTQCRSRGRFRPR